MHPARSGSDRRAARIETAAVGLVALWLARPFITPGRYSVAFDTVAYSGPNHVVTMREWAAGRIPLWNDQIFGGVPHLGNAQTAALYPLRLVTAGVEVTRALNVLVAIHLVLFAFGMLWLARRMRLAPPAGFVTAIVATAGGAVLTKTVQFEQACVVAWMPFLLVAIHAVFTSRRPARAAAGVAGATAMAVLAGHPQITYLAAALSVAWALGVAWETRNWRRVGWLGVGAALGALLTSLQLLATASATRASAISGGRRLASLRLPDRSVEPGRLLDVLLGTIRDVNPASQAGGFESIGYVGAAGLALAAVAISVVIMRTDRRRLVGVLALTAVVAVVLCVGSRTTLFELAYRIVPGFDLPRVSARWLTVAGICIAVLAGIGTDAISRRLVPAARITGAVAVSGAIVAVVATVGLAGTSGRRTVAGWALAAGAVAAAPWVRTRGRALGGLLVAAVVMVELGAAALHAINLELSTPTPMTAYSTTTTEWLRAHDGLSIALTDDDLGNPSYLIPGLRPNTNALLGIRSIDGYDGGVQVTSAWLAAVGRAVGSADDELTLRSQIGGPLAPTEAASLGIRWAQIDLRRDAATQLPGWLGPVESDDRFAVYENPLWFGEASVGAQPVEVAWRTSQRIALTTGETNRGGLLRVDMQAGAGWQVSIDGQRAAVEVVDGLFLGVEVPKGAHQIEFRYRPRWLAPGLVATLIGLLGTAALLLFDRRRASGLAARELADERFEPLDAQALAPR